MSQIRLLTRSRVSPVQTSRSFSHLHRKDGITGQILSQQQSNMYMGQRHFIGIVTRNLPRILKLRYLLFGGAVAGGTAASKKYDQWKDSLPDTSWIRDMFPDTGQISDKANTYWTEFRRSATQMKSKLSLPDKSWIPVELKNKLHNGRESVSRILEEGFNQHSKSLLLQGQGQSSIKSWQVKVRGEDDENANNSNSAESKMQTETMLMSASANSSSSSKDTADVQEELLNIQTKYQHEIDRLEKENRELRKQALLRRDSKPNTERKSSRSMRRSPIDMYSDILDSLSTYDTSYNAQDHLPRVVVVGDQSSGKTSVLEMIAQARIFPRGHGEMMTRSPVMVTLSEGPFHVAQLKGSEREYDLSNEGDLSALRKEIESRMRRSVQGGKTISSEVISLSVKGPGLHRMVLVDLPGIISTVTTGMSSDTKSSIQGLCRKYMENPNAIILCIQDGSIDAERSNVTDLVSSIDKEGKRTIFVLTKVDMAESGLHNPDRIKAILDGQLFPMKALGYFAVVTGSGNNADSISSIRQHEEEFFKKSKLARDGILKPGQMTTRNMSMAVSQRFWKMVHDSVEQQADEFKATRYNLETEWKNTYPGLRELDRGEVFEKARSEILDQLITLSQVQSEEWEQILSNSMWEKMAPTLFESIYLPACASKDAGSFHTSVDIKLKNWIDKSLPSMAVDVGRSTLKDRFSKLLADNLADNQVDTSITGAFKMAVLEEVFIRHKWDDKAADSLRVLQQICLEDRSIHSKSQWEEAVDFMVKNLEQEKVKTEKNIRDILGPGTMEQWTSWTSRSTVQHLTDNIRKELEPLLIGSAKQPRPAHLTHDEIQTVRSNVIRNNGNKPTQISDEAIKDTWYHVYRSHFLNNTITRAKMCRKAFNFYSHGQSPADCGLDCKDVQLFWRVKTMLKTSSSTLRQQIRDHEARRLERIMKEVLDEFSDNPEKLHRLISGDRVKLAEDLKKVRHIQDKLEEFIKCLNREKQ